MSRLLVGESEAEAALAPYDLSGHHLGLVVSGPDTVALVTWFAEQVGGRKLVVPAAEGAAWAWIGLRAGIAATALAATLRASPAFDATATVGSPRAQLTGFRQTHAEAVEASALRGGRSQTVLAYREVVLESLVAVNDSRSRTFMVDELGVLAAADRRSTRLRETLEAYFASSMNARATAARLGVHDQTVAYRLRSAEDCLGHPIHARRAELEVALRLRAVAMARAR